MMMLGCAQDQRFDLDDVIQKRPAGDRVVFDYVGLMHDVEESTTDYLDYIRSEYQIEILMAALPTVGQQFTVTEAAVAMFSNWRIGKAYQGRGILLLLVDDVKQVKLEVGYELEDVFTDAFTGYIEDMQLQPRYTAGELEIGLIAVMEELEARSQLKFQGDYTREVIAGLDAEYLSQGAGARRELDRYRPQAVFSGAVNHHYPAGRTPEEAWQTMIKRWRDKERDPYVGIFSPLTRLAYRDFTNMPDSRYEKEYRAYAGKPFEIRQEGDYAVVYFGKHKGWENAPLLLCRTNEGWQIDIVHQRRFVRMGPAPSWGVEFSEHPHMALLMDTFRFNGQDIPLEGDDLYTIYRDAELANQILKAEAEYQAAPTDFETVMNLGRLYTIVSISRKGLKMLKQAKKLDPADPRPYKYLAIAHVNAHYQYKSALIELETYIEKEPQDHFGYNFMGYIIYRQKKYADAIDAFEKALALKPMNCYAHFYLAYAYAWRYNQVVKLDPRRKHYQRRFRYHAGRTRTFKDTHPIRVKRLENWLDK